MKVLGMPDRYKMKWNKLRKNKFYCITLKNIMSNWLSPFGDDGDEDTDEEVYIANARHSIDPNRYNQLRSNIQRYPDPNWPQMPPLLLDEEYESKDDDQFYELLSYLRGNRQRQQQQQQQPLLLGDIERAGPGTQMVPFRGSGRRSSRGRGRGRSSRGRGRGGALVPARQRRGAIALPSYEQLMDPDVLRNNPNVRDYNYDESSTYYNSMDGQHFNIARHAATGAPDQYWEADLRGRPPRIPRRFRNLSWP